MTELYAQGVNDYMAGDYQKAIEVWDQVLDKSPKIFLVRRNIEEARSRLKDGLRASRCCSEIFESQADGFWQSQM